MLIMQLKNLFGENNFLHSATVSQPGAAIIKEPGLSRYSAACQDLGKIIQCLWQIIAPTDNTVQIF